MDLKDLFDTPPWEWPPDAAESIARTLQDRRSDASERTIAAELAGNLTVMDDQMAAVLLALIRGIGESPELRARAAIALGPVLESTDIEGFDDMSDAQISQQTFDEIQETLRGVFTDEAAPKEVRRRVLEASVRAPQDWHADAVRTAYSSGDDEWRLTAVFAMRWIDGFENEILASMQSRNPDIRREAIYAAGSQEVSAAWPQVAQLLKSHRTSKPLLLAAIDAATCIRPKEGAELVGALVDSDDEDIAEAASDALLVTGDDFEDVDFDDEDEEEDDEESTGYVN